MAVKTQSRPYSKKLILSLFTVVLLGGFILLTYSMSLWARFDFEVAQQRLELLYDQQHETVMSVNSLALPAIKLPTEHLTNTVNKLSNALPQPNEEFALITTDALKIAKQFWQLVGMTAQVMLIKLTILMAAIPLFMLAMTAGLVDGLNQRAIRTASLGRESSYVFHQLNRLFKQGLVVLLGLWLAIPVSITPALMLVPVSVLLSVMVSVTASRFKKYL